MRALPFLAALLLTGCIRGSTAINLGYDLSRIQRVGVWRFESTRLFPTGAEDIFTRQLLKLGFTVVERAQLDAVLREQQLGQSGALAPETIKKIGEILGVDGLFLGTVTYIPETRRVTILRIRDKIEEPIFKKIREKQEDGSYIEVVKQVGVKTKYMDREMPHVYVSHAKVGVSAKLVDTETGEIVWAGYFTTEGSNGLLALESVVAYLVKRLGKQWEPPVVPAASG